MKAYRICERKNQKLHTLFHAINGSREMPMNIWLTANTKIVADGSRKTSTPYISGFHCLLDINETREFISKFRKERDFVLVECEVEETHKKEHSRSNVLLAKKMKLTKIIEKLHLKSKK